MTGQLALITGAASGIGRAAAEASRRRQVGGWLLPTGTPQWSRWPRKWVGWALSLMYVTLLQSTHG